MSDQAMLDVWAKRLYEMKIADLEAEVERLKSAIAKESHDIEQMIAAVFEDEFPTYPEDWPGGGPDGDRCVGDHTPVTLVSMLVNRFLSLRWRTDG